MKKAIIMSIRPEWVAKILNGRKTIEVRKLFPKDYIGWVYIYCTKDSKYKNLINRGGFLTGMVVARFWCDKVEQFEYETCSTDISGYWLDNGEVFDLKPTCLTFEQLFDYIKGSNGYAIHISKLEIFDEPKELSEFRSCHTNKIKYVEKEVRKQTFITYKLQNRNHNLTKAPQNYCYIKELENEK